MKDVKTGIKKVISLLLAVTMLLGMAVPVMAAPAGGGDYKITIKNHVNLPDMVAGQFTAYQVFKGTVHDETSTGSGTGRTTYSLADITWGDGVKASELVTALKNATDKPISGAFTSLSGDAASAEVAQAVAKILTEKGTTAFLQAFSKIVSEHLNSSSGTSILESGNSVITVSNPGYYLIQETNIPFEDSDKNKVTSEFILKVLGEQTVTIKADIPTAAKDIVSGNDPQTAETNIEGTTAGVGDTVTFRLTGTLPDDYADYTTYAYTFTDTLDSGLTYTPDLVKVYIKNSEGTTELTNPGGETYYTVTTSGNTLKVEFSDLKKIDTISKDSKIIIIYRATVNGNVKLGSTGNQNQVSITYSNNPNVSTETGTTTTDIVKVYSFGLELTKQEADKTPLSGAGFKLSKTEGSKTLYAKFETKTANSYILSGWTENKAEATEVTSGTGGKIPTIGGLNVGTYTLTETTTPAGYNTMSPITFKISADLNTTGTYTTLTAEVTGTVRSDVSFTAGDVGTGIISGTLTNEKAPILPFTGGMGTTLFYLVGLILTAGAAAWLIRLNRKNQAKQNS